MSAYIYKSTEILTEQFLLNAAAKNTLKFFKTIMIIESRSALFSSHLSHDFGNKC